MTYDQFIAELRKFGLVQLPAPGGMFDPSLHEAIASVPSSGKPGGPSSPRRARVPSPRAPAAPRPGDGGRHPSGGRRRDAPAGPGREPKWRRSATTTRFSAFRGRAARRHKKGVPPARPSVPSRPESRRQVRGGAVQGSQRGVLGPVRPGKAQQYDRFGHAGPRAGFGGFGDFSGSASRTSSTTSSAGSSGGRWGRPPRPPRRGPPVQPHGRLRGGGLRRGEGDRRPPDGDVPRLLGHGRAEGDPARRCGACNGQGQVTMQQGFFAIRRTCGRCGGTGQIVKEPCGSCAGTGHVRESRTLKVKIPPGVDSGTRLKLRGEGEAGPAAGPAATCMWSSP